MKKTIAVVITITALAVPTLFATPLNLVGGYGPWQTGTGGEFTFQSPGVSGIIANYYSGAKNQDTTVAEQPNFQTFCVEGGEYINSSVQYYNANMSDGSLQSGIHVTYGAALLYSMFASGTLAAATPGYDYANTTSRTSDAALLQIALWHYMGGQDGYVAYDPNNKYEAYANSVLGALDNTSTGVSGVDGVYVLNMYDLSGANAQDMLIWTTPDGGTTVMLLGIGLMGLVLASRRFSIAR